MRRGLRADVQADDEGTVTTEMRIHLPDYGVVRIAVLPPLDQGVAVLAEGGA